MEQVPWALVPQWEAVPPIVFLDGLQQDLLEAQPREEAEVDLYPQRAKLLCFRDKEWEGRGQGDAKLLMDRERGKIQVWLRQEKTWKMVANFHVVNDGRY